MYKFVIKDLHGLRNKIKFLITVSTEITIKVDTKKEYDYVLKIAEKFLDKERGVVVNKFKKDSVMHTIMCIGETSELHIYNYDLVNKKRCRV